MEEIAALDPKPVPAKRGPYGKRAAAQVFNRGAAEASPLASPK